MSTCAFCGRSFVPQGKEHCCSKNCTKMRRKFNKPPTSRDTSRKIALSFDKPISNAGEDKNSC